MGSLKLAEEELERQGISLPFDIDSSSSVALDSTGEEPEGQGISLPFDIDSGIKERVADKRSLMEWLEDSLVESKDFAAGLPSEVYQAFTGEGAEYEFPDAKETTDIKDMGFWENIIPNFKTIMISSSEGKGEIIDNAFKGDDRYGDKGIQTDKFGNVYLEWEGEPYYINKKGLSEQDAGTFFGDFLKYMIPTKYVSAGIGAGDKIVKSLAKGFVAYSLTDLVDQGLERVLTPDSWEKQKNSLESVLKRSGLSGLLGGSVDQLLRLFGSRGLKTELFDQESKFPLTAGQRAGEKELIRPARLDSFPEVRKEDLLRKGIDPQSGAAGQPIIRNFDQDQLDQITESADNILERMGSGDYKFPRGADSPDPYIAQTAAQDAQRLLIEEKEALKQEASEGYRRIKESPDQPVVTSQGVRAIGDDIFVALKEEGISASEMMNYPVLKAEVDYLNRLRKISQTPRFVGPYMQNPRFRDQPFSSLVKYQQRINRVSRSAPVGSPEQRVLQIIKSTVDNNVFKGIEKGFIEGDQAIIDLLKKSSGLYRDYMKLKGAPFKGDTLPRRNAKVILRSLTDGEYTAKKVTNILFGHGKLNLNQSLKIALNTLEDVIPEESFKSVKNSLKEAIIAKAFSGRKTDRLTRSGIVNNFDEVFIKQKEIIKELFSPEEIKELAQFKKDVLPTLWAEITTNPSQSGNVLIEARDRLLGKFVYSIPWVSDALSSLSQSAGRTEAMGIIQQGYKDSTERAIFSNAIQSLIRDKIQEPEVPTDSFDSSEAAIPEEISNLLRSISESTKQKILSSVL
tara:strand:- start:5866 stop:8250 length:2385 start_codon:yes stop_codon:yes gene_type:complete